MELLVRAADHLIIFGSLIHIRKKTVTKSLKLLDSSVVLRQCPKIQAKVHAWQSCLTEIHVRLMEDFNVPSS